MSKVQSRFLSALVPALIAAAALLLGQVASADSPDAQFLAGLRQRQLFELAEAYCADRLSRIAAEEDGQAELTIELIRTLALHAANAPPAEREALWAKARSIAAVFSRRSPPHRRAVLVRLQDALTPLAIGELGRQEYEAGALSAERLEPTRVALRDATSLLEAIDRELNQEIPLRRRTPPGQGQLSADQLFSLQQHVQHQLARAQRNRALLFDRGSDDRLALLLAAVETLQRPLAQLAADEPLLSQIQLDLAACQRLLGRFEEAGQLVASLDQDGIDVSVRLQARVEQIRLAIAQDNPAEIQHLIEQGRTIAGQSAAELDFAWFEAFLSLARSASEGKLPATSKRPAAELAKQYQDQAAATANVLETTYGSYWGRRADQLLVASVPRGGSANVQLLSRTADSLYLKGALDQAIAAYDEASAQARTSGDLNHGFDLAYKAALVEQKRGEHISAANRLRILSKSFATHAQAAPAHLLAAWNAAQAVRSNVAQVDSYAAILREHLATWPKAESTEQARLWLGQLQETQSAWHDALDAYAGVPRSSPHFAAAVSGLARCWPKRLAELAAAGKSTVEPAAEAIRALQESLHDAEDRLPERWTEADRAVALAVAELIVAYQPSSSADAVRILEAAIENSPDAPAEWKAVAQVPLVLALAEQPGRKGDALTALARLAHDNPDSGAIQEKYADLLLNAGDAESLQQALGRWRLIASRTKPRTPRWYKAKYSIAAAQCRLEDRAGAATLLRYLLETPPGLKGTEWEVACRELLRKCESP